MRFFGVIFNHCALENFVRSSRKLSRTFLDISGKREELSSDDGRIWLLLIQNLLCIQSIACRRNPNFHNHSVLSKLLQSSSISAALSEEKLFFSSSVAHRLCHHHHNNHHSGWKVLRKVSFKTINKCYLKAIGIWKSFISRKSYKIVKIETHFHKRHLPIFVYFSFKIVRRQILVSLTHHFHLISPGNLIFYWVLPKANKAEWSLRAFMIMSDK